MPLKEALQNSRVAAAISQIIAESYTNPEITLDQKFTNPQVLLGRRFQENNIAYLAMDTLGEVEGFFLVGWSSLQIGDSTYDNVFLGLSGVRAKAKGFSLGINLYRRFFRDAQDRSKGTGRPVTWWFHTASPIVAGIMWRIAPNVGPTMDGNLTSFQSQIIDAVSAEYGMNRYRESQKRRFVLRGIANVRYGPAEVARLDLRRSRVRSPLENWGIKEEAGDRILFVGHSSATVGKE